MGYGQKQQKTYLQRDPHKKIPEHFDRLTSIELSAGSASLVRDNNAHAP